MEIANSTCVLVTDGRKSLFFRNLGDARFPQLSLLRSWEDDNPADREQKTGPPGRTFSSLLGGAGRSAKAETDFHEQEEARFTARMAEFLCAQALAHEMGDLIVVAPPRTLGLLRKHYHKAVKEKIVAEIGKDLVKHPVAEIERIIGRSRTPKAG
jgi:protein required for attachment to host cells